MKRQTPRRSVFSYLAALLARLLPEPQAKSKPPTPKQPFVGPFAPETPSPSNYYDWINAHHICPNCGWRGRGEDTEIRESFSEGAGRECPMCEHYFGFVA